MNRIDLSLLPTVAMFCGFAFADDLTCLPESERASASLYSHMQQEAYAALDRRGETYEHAEGFRADTRGAVLPEGFFDLLSQGGHRFVVPGKLVGRQGRSQCELPLGL